MSKDVSMSRDGEGSQGRKLESWKEIAVYLGRDVTTVQRWERQEGLPVRRLQHGRGGSIYAYAAELDSWRLSREHTRGLSDSSTERPRPFAGRFQVNAGRFQVNKVAAAVAVGIAVAAIGISALLWRREPASLVPTQNLVAVTVFELGTPNAPADPIGRQIADHVIAALGQVSTAAVIPTPIVASELGHGGSPDLTSVTRRHNATLLILGDYLVHDDQIEIHGRIVDPAGQLLYAAPPATAARVSVGELLERFGATMAGAVAIHFDEFFGGLNVISDPPTLDAYREYRSGLEFFDRDYEQTIAHLERAVELAPRFWLPRALMFYAYANLRESQKAQVLIEELLAQRSRMRPSERLFIDFLQALWDLRYAEAHRLLSEVEMTSPTSWGVNFMLMYLSTAMNQPRDVIETYDNPAFSRMPMPQHRVALWRIGAAADALHVLGIHERELEQARAAVRSAPDHPTMLALETSALAALNREEEVKAAIDRSLVTFGTDAAALMNATALELRAHHNPAAARTIAEKSVAWLKSQPADIATSPSHIAALGTALYLLDRLDEAAALFSRLRGEHPDDIESLGYVGAIAARKGEVAKAIAVSEQLAHLEGRLNGEHTFWRARIAALLGRNREAADVLREAVSQGATLRASLHTCPDFDTLQSDEAFRQLIRPQGAR